MFKITIYLTPEGFRKRPFLYQYVDSDQVFQKIINLLYMLLISTLPF